MNSKAKRNFNSEILVYMHLFAILNNKSKIKYCLDNISYYTSKSINDFIVTIFLKELDYVKKRNIVKSYNEINENLNYVKGKINIKESILKIKLNNKVSCLYDELSFNNYLNKIIKYTLYILLKIDIEKNLREKVYIMYKEFDEVELIFKVNLSDLDNIKYNNTNSHYEVLINICKFIMGCIKEDNIKKVKFLNIENKLWWVYQEFIGNYYNYYKKELEIQKVSINESKLKWNFSPIDNADLNLIPNMHTDIEIELTNMYVVIDAKCYEYTLSSYYENNLFNSGHLYQLKAYLDNLKDKTNKKLYGILLYPLNIQEQEMAQVNLEKNFYFDKENNYIIGICCINFGDNWNIVCNRLHNLLIDLNKY